MEQVSTQCTLHNVPSFTYWFAVISRRLSINVECLYIMIVVSHSKNIIVMRLQAVCGFFQDPIRPNFNYNQLLNQFRASLLLKVYSLKIQTLKGLLFLMRWKYRIMWFKILIETTGIVSFHVFNIVQSKIKLYMYLQWYVLNIHYYTEYRLVSTNW